MGDYLDQAGDAAPAPDLLRIVHKQSGQTRLVSQASFDARFSKSGWTIDGDEPHEAPSETNYDDQSGGDELDEV